MDENLTKIDLNVLIGQIDEALREIENDEQNLEVQNQLELSKMHLMTYQSRLVEPMTENAKQLIVSNITIKFTIFYNYLP